MRSALSALQRFHDTELTIPTTVSSTSQLRSSQTGRVSRDGNRLVKLICFWALSAWNAVYIECRAETEGRKTRSASLDDILAVALSSNLLVWSRKDGMMPGSPLRN